MISKILNGGSIKSFIPVDYISVTMFGINLPKDILQLIFSYLIRDRNLVNSISLVNQEFCTYILSTTKKVTIPYFNGEFARHISPQISNSYLLPIILRNAEEICFDEAKIMSWENETKQRSFEEDMEILLNHCHSNESRIRKISFNGCFSRISEEEDDVTRNMFTKILLTFSKHKIVCENIEEIQFPSMLLPKEYENTSKINLSYVFPKLLKIRYPHMKYLHLFSGKDEITELSVRLYTLLNINEFYNPRQGGIKPQFKRLKKLDVLVPDCICMHHFYIIKNNGLKFFDEIEELGFIINVRDSFRSDVNSKLRNYSLSKYHNVLQTMKNETEFNFVHTLKFKLLEMSEKQNSFLIWDPIRRAFNSRSFSCRNLRILQVESKIRCSDYQFLIYLVKEYEHIKEIKFLSIIYTRKHYRPSQMIKRTTRTLLDGKYFIGLEIFEANFNNKTKVIVSNNNLTILKFLNFGGGWISFTFKFEKELWDQNIKIKSNIDTILASLVFRTFLSNERIYVPGVTEIVDNQHSTRGFTGELEISIIGMSENNLFLWMKKYWDNLFLFLCSLGYEEEKSEGGTGIIFYFKKKKF